MNKTRQYKRGWKIDREMNNILRELDNILNQKNLNQFKQIKIFKDTTGKGRRSFFRYKKVLDNSTYSKKYGKKLLAQTVKESYGIIEFACKHWMEQTGKSRSTFYRLKKEIKENK